MDINLYDIVQHILNVVVLYVIVRSLLYKPVRNFMLQREEGINQKLESARATVKEADAMHEEYKELLNNASKETRLMLEERTTEADRAFRETTEKAEREALNILDAAQSTAVQYKNDALREAHKEVANMAVEIASKILEREISEEDNREIIDDFFNKWTEDNGRA